MAELSRSSIVLLASLGLAASASAQEASPAEDTGIWIADVSGELQQVEPATTTFLDEPPEQVRQIVLSVESFAHTATGALSAARLAVTRVHQALSQTGLVTRSVTSDLAFVEPRYRERILAGSWEEPRRTGYDAGYVVTVAIPAGLDTGRLVDAAMGAGATRVLALGPAAGR